MSKKNLIDLASRYISDEKIIVAGVCEPCRTSGLMAGYRSRLPSATWRALEHEPRFTLLAVTGRRLHALGVADLTWPWEVTGPVTSWD